MWRLVGCWRPLVFPKTNQPIPAHTLTELAARLQRNIQLVNPLSPRRLLVSYLTHINTTFPLLVLSHWSTRRNRYLKHCKKVKLNLFSKCTLMLSSFQKEQKVLLNSKMKCPQFDSIFSLFKTLKTEFLELHNFVIFGIFLYPSLRSIEGGANH